MKKKLTALAVIAVLALSLLTGCQSGTEEGVAAGPVIYYRRTTAPASIRQPYSGSLESDYDTISAVLKLMNEAPAGGDAAPLLPDTVTLLGWEKQGRSLALNFSGGYRSLAAADEVLLRAGYVRTLTQLSGIDYLIFQVEGEPLTDRDGHEIGRMKAESFIENAGKTVNAYLRHDITLFFTDASGTLLIPEGRSIYYNSNKSLEWAIVERLIAGPKAEGSCRTLAPETEILSVSVQDRICYVNFSDSLKAPADVGAEVLLASIADSLILNCEIDKVQFAINGNIEETIGDISLNQLFEANTAIIAQVDPT